MMKTIFESETEVGNCDYSAEENYGFRYAEPDSSVICAHTVAVLNGHRGLLKIEQHCYLRHGEEIRDQPWVCPEVTLEPALDSKEEMVELAAVMHEQFVERVRNRFQEQYLV
jgi:hypothetical protein